MKIDLIPTEIRYVKTIRDVFDHSDTDDLTIHDDYEKIINDAKLEKGALSSLLWNFFITGMQYGYNLGRRKK